MSTMDVVSWDGAAWRSMYRPHAAGRTWSWWDGGKWHRIAPLRLHRDYAGQRAAMLKDGRDLHDQSQWHARAHMWDGTMWWPPETHVMEAHWTPKPDGSVVAWWYAQENHNLNDAVPATPLPPMQWWVTDLAGAVADADIGQHATVTRARTGNRWWQYTVTISEFVAALLDWDHTAPTRFGVDGEGKYGPYEVRFGTSPVKTPTDHRPPPPVALVPPVAVTHFAGSATGQHTVRLTWHAVHGATGYHLWSGGKDYGVVTGTSYPVTGLAHAGTSYPFVIRSVNKDGVSPPATTHVTTDAAPVTVHHPPDTSVKTRKINPSWDAAYDGDHSRRSDHPSNPWQSKLVTGRFDSTHGNTHSVVRFDLSGLPHGAVITSVKLTLYALHWWSNAGGTAVIKNIHVGNNAQSHHTPESGPVTQMHWGTKTGTKTVTISTGQGFANGKFNAVQIGPATTTGQAGYGVFDGTGTRKPYLTIKYHL